MTKICPECKAVHPDDAGFCQNCGKKLRQPQIKRGGNKPSYNWIFILITCFVGFIVILGIIGIFYLDTNSTSSKNIEPSESVVSGTWHSVVNLSGEGDDDTSSFQIKGDKMKIKVEVGGSHYGTTTFYIYPEGKTVDYVGQGSVSSFAKSSASDEFNITVSPGSYYLKIEAEDTSNLDMDWKIEVFDYY